MRTLILGGTVFLGRALTDAALVAGFDVTHFNRGRSRADDARVRTVRGDRTRDEDLAKLSGPWDAVFDTSAYLPQVVARSVERLRDAGRYLFVSSISAYSGPRFDEEAALQSAPDPLPDAMTPE